ncbi:MAG: ribonuclease III [bacterium]|nr:ribonuclease III [bacterium]
MNLKPDLRHNLRALEQRIHHTFRDPRLLLQALKHRSYLDTSGEKRVQSNERLEFLGDAVLDLVVSDHFFRTEVNEDEGALTNFKSTIVSGAVLATQARKIGLGEYLLLSENEAKSGGRYRDSILEDALEALIGAIYLDGGVKPAHRFVQQFLLSDSEKILAIKSFQNYKSILQEYAQGRGSDPPVYTVLEATGPDHDKRYLVEVCLEGKIVGQGRGRSKKEAEQRAAAEGVKQLTI